MSLIPWDSIHVVFQIASGYETGLTLPSSSYSVFFVLTSQPSQLLKNLQAVSTVRN